MSRCFPFPPPGYERKRKLDNLDIIKQEKHKEKKHKKEKKDKEKKERKEKREKERSDEKHREKKDKKDKSKEKKKDREKDREKDRQKSDSNVFSEFRSTGPPEGHVHKPSQNSKDRGEDSKRSAVMADKRMAGPSLFYNGEQLRKSNHLAPEPKNSTYPREPGRRNIDEEKLTSNQFVDKTSSERKKVEVAFKSAEKSPGTVVDGKSNEKRASDGREDKHGVVGESKSSGSTLLPNSVGIVQNRVGGKEKPLEGKEKLREKEADEGRGKKRKERDKEKTKRNEKNREKEKKKVEKKMKLAGEQRQVEQSRNKDVSENHTLKLSVKDVNRKDFSGLQSLGPQTMSKDSNHGIVSQSTPGKRKEIGLNGVNDEHHSGSNKLARTTAHPVKENGRSLEGLNAAQPESGAQQRPPMNIKVERTMAPDDTQRPPISVKVDGKERKLNGLIGQSITESSQPAVKTESAVKAEPVVKAEPTVKAAPALKAARRTEGPPVKPPHPDTKYLSTILSVPKMDEWSDLDDQEWLFSSNSSQTRKSEAQSSGADETPQVWGQALWLEPVDVYALPYVIPH